MKKEIDKLESLKDTILNNKIEINKILSKQDQSIDKYNELPTKIAGAKKAVKDFAILNINITNAPLGEKNSTLTIPLNLAFDPLFLIISIYRPNSKSGDNCFLFISYIGIEYLIEDGDYGSADKGFSVTSYDKNNLILTANSKGATNTFNFSTVIAIGK